MKRKFKVEVLPLKVKRQIENRDIIHLSASMLENMLTRAIILGL